MFWRSGVRLRCRQGLITWGTEGGKERHKQGLFLETGFSERWRGPEREKRERVRHPAALCEQRKRENGGENKQTHMST